MDNILQEMRHKREYEEKFNAYVRELMDRSNKETLEILANYRDFPLEILKESEVFYIGEMTEMLLPNYIDDILDFGVISETNNKPIFHNRYVIPIKNEEGIIQNLVGYSYEAKERYIYGTSKYYRRRDTLWGLENLKLAYELGFAIVTEGITDAIRIRSLGFKNAFAKCGTHESKYVMGLLNRCRYGIIRIPDRDSAGIKSLKHWECNRHITLFTNLKYKDIDEMCKESEFNKEVVKQYINDCINWLTKEEHRGQKAMCESVTIL